MEYRYLGEGAQFNPLSSAVSTQSLSQKFLTDPRLKAYAEDEFSRMTGSDNNLRQLRDEGKRNLTALGIDFSGMNDREVILAGFAARKAGALSKETGEVFFPSQIVNASATTGGRQFDYANAPEYLAGVEKARQLAYGQQPTNSQTFGSASGASDRVIIQKGTDKRVVMKSQLGGFTKAGFQVLGDAPHNAPLGLTQLNPIALTSDPESLEQKILDNIQEKIESGIINPDVEISPEMSAQFLQQAKDELAPYFGEQIRQKREDYSRQLGQIGEDVLASERNLESQYGQGLENIQEQMARRGLTFSTIRGGQEQNLLSKTQAAIEAGRREAERRALESGTEAERTLGSSYLPETVGVTQAPKPILGKPGVFGFEKSGGTRTLFAPIGGVKGSLEKERLLAETARQKELTGAERQLRGYYTY